MMADLVLFRRMRGLFWGALVTAVVGLPLLLVLGMTVAARLATSSDFAGQIGGPAEVLVGGLGTLVLTASIAGVLFGTTAGSVDHQRGVLRDLVLAGRSAITIVLRRLLAAGAWMLGAVVATSALLMLVAVVLAPEDGSLDMERALREVASILPGLAATLMFGAALALLLGSRGPAIAVYFVFSFIVDGVLLVIPKVGDWWAHASFAAAEQQVASWIGRDSFEAPMAEHSNGVALAILLAWAVVPLAAGLWRISNRDL
jgi:hypothetical protein